MATRKSCATRLTGVVARLPGLPTFLLCLYVKIVRQNLKHGNVFQNVTNVMNLEKPKAHEIMGGIKME